MLNFLLEHKDILCLVGGAILGALIPKAKIYLLGKLLGKQFPQTITLKIADIVDTFEQGHRNAEFNGNKNIISNEQLHEGAKKLKNDLIQGLGKKLN